MNYTTRLFLLAACITGHNNTCYPPIVTKIIEIIQQSAPEATIREDALDGLPQAPVHPRIVLAPWQLQSLVRPR